MSSIRASVVEESGCELVYKISFGLFGDWLPGVTLGSSGIGGGALISISFFVSLSTLGYSFSFFAEL